MVFGVQSKVTYYKNIFKFRETWSFSKWFIAQTNIQTDRQTNFTLSHGNKLAMVSKWKGGLYNNNKKYMHIYTNRSICSKVTCNWTNSMYKNPRFFFFLNSRNFFKKYRSIFEKIASMTSQSSSLTTLYQILKL